MSIEFNIAILILGVLLIFLLRNELRELINRIIRIDYGDKYKIILDQYQAKKEFKGKNINAFFEKVYEKITGAQIHFLILLKQFYSKGTSQGMPCGYASNYHQNLVKSRTRRYDGWITPFFTAYLEENNLVSVFNNYYHMEKLGFEFLDYIDKLGYSEEDKEF